MNFNFKKWSDSETFNQNMKSYNNASVNPPSHTFNTKEWDACFTSTMKRAVDTAKIIYNQKITGTDLLREVTLKAGFSTKIKIPVFLWAVIGRFQWYFNSKSQPETKNMSYRRARTFFSGYCFSDKNHHKLLIITHGFFMLSLRRELLKLGFNGPRLLHVKNGKLYQFEKNSDINKSRSKNEQAGNSKGIR
ncbi:MAG: histidine phosphatase family protein [Candidatus Aminicenantes bacterium]|nr:histidine phosphatase family protein [Candidatus Aminicenantes bacterium]